MSRVFCISLLIPLIVWPLTIGTITDRPSKYYPKFKALALYIEKRIASLGIEEKVSVRFARDIDHMEDLVRKGQVDVFIDSLYPVLRVCEVAGCEPVLVRWKNGVRHYRSVIFVREGSPVEEVSDLVGSKIAFDSPYSTSGYFVPRILIERMGLRLIELKNPSDPVPRGYIGYTFAGQEENVVAWVFFGKVQAGSVDSTRLRILSGDRVRFRVLASSEEIPRHLVCFSKNVKRNVALAVREVLLSMDEDPEGSRVLRTFDNTVRFEELTEKDREVIASFRRAVKEYAF